MSDRAVSFLELRREARRIHDDIMDAQVGLPNGRTGWIGFDEEGGELVVRGQKGLYSGQLGIALYFAAMYNVFEDRSYLESVFSTVDFLLKGDADEIVSDIGLGAASGLASLVYGLSVLSDLTEDRYYRRRAEEFAVSIADEEIQADERFDVLFGASGALLGLLRLYEQCQGTAVLEKAISCGEHLLNNRYSKWGYKVWDTHWNDEIKSFSTGAAHGAAGISHALYRLYAHTGRKEFREAADDAVKFENIFYSEERSNWKANWTAVPHYPCWWCYGQAGIGLSRIGGLEQCESAMLRRDVDRVRQNFDPQLASNDSICHGTFSQVDLLIELARKFDGGYVDQARSLVAEAIERRQVEGGFRVAPVDVVEVYNPPFFVGTAGIGYTILRLLRPDEIPSVLRFE